MSTINLTLVATAFDSNPSWTVEQFHQAVVNSITSATTTSSVLVGRVGGSMPGTDIGPWLNDGTWFYHNGSTYVPAILQIGDAGKQITLTGDPSDNRSIVFPDKDGTVALLSDVYEGGRGTDFPTIGATTTLDWGIALSFSVPLTQNTSILNVSSLPGQEAVLGIYNTSPGYTVTWTDSGINWGDTGSPAASTVSKSHVIRLRNIGGQIYGKLEVSNAT